MLRALSNRSPAPRDRGAIASTIEELQSLETRCPDLRTGAADHEDIASFLRVLERLQVIFGGLAFLIMLL